jgi:hypothetical protein
MSPTHPFRTSRKSPHDDSGPNSAAHRRSLASLQTHDRDTPLARRSLGEGGSPRALAPAPARASAEIRRQSASVELPSRPRRRPLRAARPCLALRPGKHHGGIFSLRAFRRQHHPRRPRLQLPRRPRPLDRTPSPPHHPARTVPRAPAPTGTRNYGRAQRDHRKVNAMGSPLGGFDFSSHSSLVTRHYSFYSVQLNNRKSPKSLKTKIGGKS